MERGKPTSALVDLRLRPHVSFRLANIIGRAEYQAQVDPKFAMLD
jgi:hypothetical protein